MAIAIAVWSLELAPGKTETVLPVADIKITNVALGDAVVDPTGRSTVKMIYNPYSPDDEDGPDEQTTVLCSLTAGKFEHTTTDIILEKETPFTFTVGGKNTVYLSGNYIDQDPLGHPPFDEYESDIMSDDEGDLDDLASDVDMESDDMTDASRFEEVDEELATNLKRGREPDATGDSYDVGKKSKKLKADNGQAISADTGKDGATGTKQDKKDKKDEKKSDKKGEKKDERTVEKKDEKDEKKGEKKKEKRKAEKKDEKKDESKVEKDEEKDESKVEKDEKKDEKDEKKGKKKDKLKSISEKVLPGGLKIEEFNIGDGPAAKKGNTVSMRYIGKLENRKVFDKNVMGKPFTFRLGQGEVIKGWDEGIVGMQVNGERKLTIPPSLAYGKKGTEGIPPNSTLTFEVKLLEIK